MRRARKIGILGYGAIGQEMGDALTRLGETGDVAAVLVRPGRDSGPFRPVHDAAAFAQAGVEVALECAGHAAVAEYGPALLASGVDLILTSISALADPKLVEMLRANAKGRLLIASGAVGGLDGLVAARLQGLDSTTYISAKPPEAWKGTPAETLFDLDAIEGEQVLFEGSARDAALNYPKNANVSVAVALCSLGMDRTRVRLVASRKLTSPLGVIEGEGRAGKFTFSTLAYATASNPKTSALTAYSLLQCARLEQGLPAFKLLDECDA